MIDRKEDNQFHLVSKYEPSGDQPQAIEALVDNIEGGEKAQILKGATGTGKTYTMSQVIQRVINQPWLSPTIKLWQVSFMESSRSSSQTMLWNTSFPTMISISQRPMYPHQIPISKKIAL